MFQRRFMQGGIGGLGGGLDSAFNPLKQMLANSIAQEQVEPFVEEVKQMAKERFDLGNGMSGGGQFTGDRPQIGFNQVGAPSMAVGYPSAGQTAFRGNQDMRREILEGFGGGSLSSTKPFAGSPDPLKTAGEFNRMIIGKAFGMKDGGEVMNSPMSAGLGSFLASNIDEFGRNGDTEMIHATREEVIMPKGMMEDPQIRETIRQAFERTGRDMAEYTVGSGQMNVNPFTGYEEAFDLIKGIKNIFKKAAPILLPAAVSFLFPGMAPVVSGAIAGGVGSLLQGGDFKDALKGAAVGGLTSSLMKGISTGGKDFGFKGNPNYKTFEMRRFGEGSGPDLSGKLSAAADKTKGFFTKPTMSVEQLAKDAKIDLATASEATKLDLIKQASASGGINLGRAIPAGLGIMAVTGAFDPIEEDPLDDPYENTSRELLEMYPERYTTGPILPPIRTNLDDVIQRRRNRDIVAYAAEGGEMFPRKTGAISGPGTGTSDDIPAMLSDGEFVMTAKAVRGAGNGSRKQGVKKMYDMMRAFEGGAVA